MPTRIQGARPAFSTADTHPSYLHREGVNRLQLAANMVEQIKAHKNENPAGRIHDPLVSALIKHVTASVKDPTMQPEDPRWSPMQRIVWRAARGLTPEQKVAVIADRTLYRGMKAFVQVNAGRWMVVCPMPGCSSASHASWDDRRFFCCDCAMKAIGGKWIEVVWPESAPAIEAQLMIRPESVRHWLPGETKDDLAAQDVTGLGKATVIDPATFPKSETRWIDGKQIEVPIIRFGTPDWDEAQKAAS